MLGGFAERWGSKKGVGETHLYSEGVFSKVHILKFRNWRVLKRFKNELGKKEKKKSKVTKV